MGRISSYFFFCLISALERTRPAASVRRLTSFTSLVVLGSSPDSEVARTSVLAHADSRRVVPWGCSLSVVPEGIQEMSRRGGLFCF